MKTLKDLTPEIKGKIAGYKSACVDKLYSGEEHSLNKREDTVKYIEEIYSIAGFEKPVVIIAKNPDVYKTWFKLLNSKNFVKKIDSLFSFKNDKKSVLSDNNKLEKELEEELEKVSGEKLEKGLDEIKVKSHWLFLCSIYSRVYLMWYKFIKDEFNITCTKSQDLDKLYGLVNKTFITRCFFTNKYVLVLKTPSKIVRNEVGFHNTSGGAIQFEGGYNMYYINGRRVDKKIIDMDFTFQDFLNEKNEDTKGAMITVIRDRKGQEGLMDFLGAVEVDCRTITHNSGHTETFYLYKTNEKYDFLQDRHGNFGQPYCWSCMECPSTGTKYLVDNSADFTNAIEAMKFLRPSFIPMDMKYDFSLFNN